AQVWHYRWDSRNQLRAVDTPSGETWYYRYDPFGRRVSKRCAERGEEVRYLWDGDQIAEVRHYHQGQQTSRRHWVHNGWELVVQQRHTVAGGWDTDFVSSAPNGAPQALYDSEGELRWQAPKATLWGQRAVSKTESADPELAFAGQLRDSESGLCYNRFRYYDPAGGGYISPDPIGLLGGLNGYQYAPNPLTWIDPLGLARCSIQKLEEKGFTGVKSTKNGGLDYANSNALYSKEGVNPIRRIEYTGNYHKDFEQANIAALGQKTTPKGYVWHHLDDYDPVTNTGTMQLVQQAAHRGIPHVGGVSQYQEITGLKYIFKTW
ncbi:RHS repeat-associated core domain-containing protein, partial [Lonsdalea quercina]|uniref:RHS repeat-associated core domain-containing protein n=1 Tax=Lonsdalea quercina TaxID=71657 RepID=UPI003976A598